MLQNAYKDANPENDISVESLNGIGKPPMFLYNSLKKYIVKIFFENLATKIEKTHKNDYLELNKILARSRFLRTDLWVKVSPLGPSRSLAS